MANDKSPRPEANPDPIIGAPGAHPVGVGLGAAAGGIAAAAAAAGTLAAGPIGTVVGAAVGAVVGGLGGKAAAESINPTVEENYWRENFDRQPYYRSGTSYNDYSPAYQLGIEAPSRYGDRPFEAVESDLETDYNALRGQSPLEWSDARLATRAAWEKVRRA
jgi:hypothetical protein